MPLTVDDIGLFKALTLPEIGRIVELVLDDLRARLAERRMTLELTEEARSLHRRAGLRSRLRRASAAALHRTARRDPYRARAVERRRA